MTLPLVILPGLHGGSKLLDRFSARLPDWIAPRVVTYPTDRIITYDDILAGLELPDAPFALLAESYSGPLGVRIAASRPTNLRALVLTATFARSPHPWFPRWAAGAARAWMFRLPIQQHACRRLLLNDDGSCEQLDEGWRELVRADPDVLAARIREVLRVDVRRLLPEIQVPTFYLQASRDRVVPGWALRDIRQRLPQIESVTLDSPHPILQRRAAKSAAAIADFLQRATIPHSSAATPSIRTPEYSAHE